MPVLKPAALLANRIQAVRDYHAKTGIPRAELSLSGGIDSAVMAGILVLALGAENVTLDHLGINTNPEQTARAQRLAAAIGCRLAVGDFDLEYLCIINSIKLSLKTAGYSLDEIEARIAADPTIQGSIRSTLRCTLGRAYNRLTGGGLHHGTGNECEDRIFRYYQKDGDGGVDSNPIAMLSKTEVYQLAFELGLTFEGRNGPHNAVDAYAEHIGCVPSADLHGNGDGHTDEDELFKQYGVALTYGKVDGKTGKVLRIGTIERVARFLDEQIPDPNGGQQCGGPTWQEARLFSEGLSQDDMRILVDRAFTSLAFGGSNLTPDQILSLLRASRKAERQTRHKLNPNIPTYGTRAGLIEAGILTDDLSAYGVAPRVLEPA